MKRHQFLALPKSEQLAYVLKNDGAKSEDGRSQGCGLLTQTHICNNWKLAIEQFAMSLER